MNRIAWLVAVAAVVWAGRSEAGGPVVMPQGVPLEAVPAWNAPPPVSYGYGMEDSGYGWSPHARKWFKKKAPYVAAPPAVQPTGTLVFPNHPFARSPRDFFMTD